MNGESTERASYGLSTTAPTNLNLSHRNVKVNKKRGILVFLQGDLRFRGLLKNPIAAAVAWRKARFSYFRTGKLELFRRFGILPVVKLFEKRLNCVAEQEYTIV